MAQAQRLDIQLMLQAVQHLVADRAVITEPNEGRSFGGQRLFSQPKSRSSLHETDQDNR